MRKLLIAGALLLAACAAPEVSEPAGLRTCAGASQEDLDDGLDARTVTTGPVQLVAFRVSPAPANSQARNFKVMIRLEPGAQVRLAARTPGTALLFDRAAFRRDNVYALSDGTGEYGFAACPDRSAAWVGAILTSGPTTVTLAFLYGGAWHEVRVTAYTPK